MVRVIGITGGIGAGKSSASAILGELGAFVIDADKAAHEVYLPDTPAWREIVAAFGEEVLAADRTIDRRKLGPRVFADPAALQTLNGILHGKIFAYVQGQIAYIRRTEAARVAAVEAAVLLEAGWQALVRRALGSGRAGRGGHCPPARRPGRARGPGARPHRCPDVQRRAHRPCRYGHPQRRRP